MTAKKIIIEKPKRGVIEVTIVGTTSLLTHPFCKETQDKMLEQQVSGKKMGRERKDPQKEFEKSLYPKQNGKHVFPGGGVKMAMVNTAKTFAPNIHKTQVTGEIFIPVDWLEIVGDEPVPRTDMVRVGRNAPDIRIRAEFNNWSMKVPIEFSENGGLTSEQILNLLSLAGFHVGIGDWRPACRGIHGRFEIAQK